jgi:CRISPR system Cascade subunit CasD
MTSYLVFTLAAPFGAFCDTASSAGTADKPTRLDPTCSALVGFLGAALGEPREQLGSLSAALWIAVRIGVRPRPDPKPDYHTITPPMRPEGRERWARFEELRGHLGGGDTAGSIQSWRGFWSLGLWTASVASRGKSGPPLDTIATALKAPRYPLYVGRKAYPVGLPPDPQIVDATTLVNAHTAYGWPWTRHARLADALEPLVQMTSEISDEFIYDLDHPEAPKPAREERREDVPDHAMGESGALIRGFRTRTVGVAFVAREAS